jgi:hypothetical protein
VASIPESVDITEKRGSRDPPRTRVLDYGARVA